MFAFDTSVRTDIWIRDEIVKNRCPRAVMRQIVVKLGSDSSYLSPKIKNDKYLAIVTSQK